MYMNGLSPIGFAERQNNREMLTVAKGKTMQRGSLFDHASCENSFRSESTRWAVFVLYFSQRWIFFGQETLLGNNQLSTSNFIFRGVFLLN